MAAEPSGWDLYLKEAGLLLPELSEVELREMATSTCRELDRNWTMENAAAALMNSGAGTGFVLDYLDLLTEHACPNQRDEYEAWLVELEEFRVAQEAPQEPERVYLSPDPATVRQWLRDLWHEYLGRDPDENELSSWTDYYLAVHRESWEAEARGELWDVDARVRGKFEEKYGPEMRMTEDRQRAQDSRESVQGGTDTMACMSNPDDPRCDD